MTRIFVFFVVIHKTDSESCLQNERILISFEDSIVASEYRNTLDELSKVKLIRISPNKRYQVEELLHKLEKEEKRTDGYRHIMTGLYIMELLTLLCRYKTTETLPETESERQISAITEYIRSNYGQDLSLGALSHLFGLSESCLCRKFKAVTGMGLNEYITNVRIHNAAQQHPDPHFHPDGAQSAGGQIGQVVNAKRNPFLLQLIQRIHRSIFIRFLQKRQ